jgi:hypothetical protein
MSTNDSLDSSIENLPKSVTTRHDIIRGFWGNPVSLLDFQEGRPQCEKYFLYYTEQCRIALQDGGRHILAQTHRDILEVASYLRGSQTREQLKRILRPKLPIQPPDDADEIMDNTIDLTIRLLIMVNVGGLRYGVSDISQLNWKDNTLKEFIQGRFIPSQALKDTPIKLEKIFNARNLERIGGIKIIWTSNLADHLSMKDDDTRVAIFHHASFLKYQNDKCAPPISTVLFPFFLLLRERENANSTHRKSNTS